MTDDQLENRAHAGKIDLLDDSSYYEELLKKYMRLVVQSQESDFLYYVGSYSSIDITDQDFSELERISREIKND